MSAYIFALLSNFSWGLSSQSYTLFSKKISPVWTNMFKGVCAGILFGLTVIFSGGFKAISLSAVGLFLLSGFIGLGFGDIFTFKAYSIIGPSRATMISSFRILFVGVMGYVFFGQKVSPSRFISIIFLLVCVFIFALESYKKTAKWHFSAMFMALLGMLFDSVAVIASRAAFDISDINGIEANAYRCVGATCGFIILAQTMKIKFFAKINKIPKKALLLITAGSIIGTYFGLIFYLEAIKRGNLATVSAITTTMVVFTAFFECLFEKKWPSKYLIAAFGCLVCAMYFLI
ncbi:MAG: DMT family transporter [Elusimicrobiota bacterium]|jgi:drug/metabolite transporter (DMT)-like permease|nr:DMT family transporter [Elusimicrobiota bacterium]